MQNSELVMFEDEGLGNYLASLMYSEITGGKVEQKVEAAFYRSQAPFWVEIVRSYRTRREYTELMKESGTKGKRSLTP